MARTALGLDIGGANLKAAHSAGGAQLIPFALWKHPEKLEPTLRELVASFPPFDVIAVTMTGELCDCFESKRIGVETILQAVQASNRSGCPIWVWCNDGQFVDVETAKQDPLPAAAANWLALATFVGRFAARDGSILLDIGSTTTDVIPLLQGQPIPVGRTDPERMRASELLYTGVRRTPVCALLGEQVAAELFATTLDAYLLLDLVAENATDDGTADGRPATKVAAHARLARMLCADVESCAPEETSRLAEVIRNRQLQLIRAALANVSGRLNEPIRTVVLSGAGEFLGRLGLSQPENNQVNILSLADELGPTRSDAACAYALAMLASEAVWDG